MKKRQKTYFYAMFAMLIMLVQISVGCGSTAACILEETTAESVSCHTDLSEPDESQEAFYEIYKPYGVSYDEEKQALYFEGETVRCFWDGTYIEDGISICRCNYFNEKGNVDIHSVREAVRNDDGSIDPFGILTGIEKSTQKEFEERDLSEFYRTDTLEATASSHGSFSLSDLFTRRKSFADIFKEYKEFGLTYLEAKEGSGVGNLYYNGKPVNAFVDISEEGIFSFHSTDGGEINVQTVYNDKGKLTGLEMIPDAR